MVSKKIIGSGNTSSVLRSRKPESISYDMFSTILKLIDREEIEPFGQSLPTIAEQLNNEGKPTNKYTDIFLHYCLEKNNSARVEMAKILIENYGANINSNRFEKTALTSVINNENPNLEFVKYLIEKGADVNMRDSLMYPIHYAVKNENIDLIKLLIKNGADVNSEAWDMTPLMIASKKNNLEIVKIFLEKDDININKINFSGQTAFDLTTNYDIKTEIAKIRDKQDLEREQTTIRPPTDTSYSSYMNTLVDNNSTYNPLILNANKNMGGKKRRTHKRRTHKRRTHKRRKFLGF